MTKSGAMRNVSGVKNVSLHDIGLSGVSTTLKMVKPKQLKIEPEKLEVGDLTDSTALKVDDNNDLSKSVRLLLEESDEFGDEESSELSV
ncbi:hypothetical protein ADUPG1_010245 [Aduncisulcus paluster]|uniref:Uncharacterized protein n=1 Tax=Aduncisulcus paluster TaxID=2918883 RepID=A0ABQ5JQH5_9EUKA|nr:hypothetical protein ADUPG1_010245 [Aduncisulcus paluster]